MNKGERYIIEIEEVHTHYDDAGEPYKLARIKGFKSLVFDEVGLDKLEKYEEEKKKLDEEEKFAYKEYVKILQEIEESDKEIFTAIGKEYD